MTKFLCLRTCTLILASLAAWQSCFAQNRISHEWKVGGSARLATTEPAASGEKQNDGLSLDDLEAMALGNNPTLNQAAAQVRAARGAAYQAGRFLNPVIGYTSDQIGVNGTAGELQGAFVAQEFVTGGKLRLSRAKFSQRAEIAQTNAYAQQHRVLNDVKIQFYRTLAAQELVKVHRELLANAEDGVQTTKEMVNLGQANPAGLLQAEIEAQRHRLNLQMAANETQHAWRNLVSVVGVPELQQSPLAGSLEPDEDPLHWESALGHLLANSPELLAACQKIQQDEITVRRERAEPIPNLILEATVGRNFESRNTVTGVVAAISLPIFDRNQGTVRQAEADLFRSRAEARRLELELRTRLAARYREYRTAWQHTQAYQRIMLPKAKQAYDMLHASYKARRAAWPSVLSAQRMYLDLRRDYVRNLLAYRESDVSIRGMLLIDGLMEPPGPVSGGHIDATPKPR